MDTGKKKLVPPVAATRSSGRAAGAGRAPRRMRSAELFADHDLIVIEHAGREYRLRITNNGKLILTA